MSGHQGGNKNNKYWHQRYSLFSRFDDGIRLDDKESWFSVTPEPIAKHIAWRFSRALQDQHAIIFDGFCGAGGNLIQFAKMSPHVTVIGCDINQDRLEMAKHNAKIYGVQRQCQFILGDFLDVIRSLNRQHIDAIFLSPPWGGVDYHKKKKYSLSMMTPNGFDILRLCRQHLTNNIAFLMPRNIDFIELKDVLLTDEYPVFEFERNLVGTKTKTITVYFGDLVNEAAEADDVDIKLLDQDSFDQGY